MPDPDFGSWRDSPIETLRRDLRADLKEQFKEFKEDQQRRHEEMRLALNSRLGELEKDIGRLEGGKADKRVETIVYAGCGLVLTAFIVALIGLVIMSKSPSGSAPPPAPPVAKTN